MAKKRRVAPKKAKKQDRLRVLVVEARYYEHIAEQLLAGAMAALEAGNAEVDRVTVPGALEITPAIAIAVEAAALRRQPYDGVVALGCVIQGETFHFDIVATQSARALMDFAVAQRLPAGNGILTVDNEAQALRRAALSEGNKGGEAAQGRVGADWPQTRPGPALMAAGAPTNAKGADKDGRKANKRGAARLAAVQALYQMDLAGTGVNEILAEFESHWIGREVEGAQYLPAEAKFFRDIVNGVLSEQRALDPMIDDALAKSWPLKRIETVLRAVLRGGAYELSKRSDVPARVVVSEYADIAAAFVERDETGMVNAVLDQLARQLRPAEFDRAAG